MFNISSAPPSALGYFRNGAVNFRSHAAVATTASSNIPALVQPTTQSLLQVHQLRLALSAIKPGQLSRTSNTIAAQTATATSNSSLNFTANLPTRLTGTEEINTAPTSFQHNGPAWIGQTITAPWSGNSTADATVSGNYDGSDGSGILTFKVNRAGTHGEDDLRIRVSAPDGSFIENINIDKNDPLDKVYELSNGLSITLNAGDLIKNDTFEVDTTLVSSSYTPNDPGWTGSTATPTIGGSYDGDQGTGDLTFRVTRAGEHGEDDLKIKVYAPDDSFIQTITVRKNDAIDKVYNLSNGLTFSLGDGELIKNESFNVSVVDGEPTNFTASPEWNFSSATATITGTYDGSNGTGTLKFKALDTGVHGEDDLRVRVYNPDGSTLETISIDANDPIDEAYVLSNDLSATFSAGELIKHETFTIDVEASASYSTTPNDIESTAAPVLKGIYDGSLGTDTLTFLVTQEGTHGTDDLSLDVFASDGSLLETLNISASDAIDQTYALASGVTFSLGAGMLALNETFTLDVYEIVPTSVNPDLSFNGTGANDPKFEDQFTITDGSFELNGNTINVLDNDSINSVLDRINNAGIDITASFDSASETIVMTRNTPGSENDIVLANDTSGFLAATKLSTATSVAVSGDETTILSDLEMMSGVTSGLLDINGVSVAIDVNVDTLEDVLARIDVLVSGVDADFDETSGHVSIFATDMIDLILSSGGTGFFEALEISEGLHEHVAAKTGTTREGYSFSTRRDMARAINKFAKSFNAIFEDKYGEQASPMLQEIRNDLKTTVAEIFGADQAEMESRIGIAFDFADPNEGVVEFSNLMKKQFNASLKTTAGAMEFQDLFFGHAREDDGLTDRMLQIVKRAESSLSLELGSIGSFVDVWA